MSDVENKGMTPEVTVMGLGYVGLTTALSLARAGICVSGFEISEEKAQSIRRGEIPFREPGLPDLLKICFSKGTFRIESELRSSETTFITVGTPSSKNGEIDLSYVKSASSQIGSLLKGSNRYHLIVMKSTVTPGTTENVVKPIIEMASGKIFGRDLGLVMNPEFLREGSALKDMSEPDRLVLGEFDEKSGDTLIDLYKKSLFESHASSTSN